MTATREDNNSIRLKIGIGDWCAIFTLVAGLVSPVALWVYNQSATNELQDERIAELQKHQAVFSNTLTGEFTAMRKDIADLSASVNRLIGKMENMK